MDAIPGYDNSISHVPLEQADETSGGIPIESPIPSFLHPLLPLQRMNASLSPIIKRRLVGTILPILLRSPSRNLTIPTGERPIPMRRCSSEACLQPLTVTTPTQSLYSAKLTSAPFGMETLRDCLPIACSSISFPVPSVLALSSRSRSLSHRPRPSFKR
jgi:hypothetical protein